MVEARFLSDSWRDCVDPALLVEAEETALEIVKLIGGVTLDDVAYMTSDELEWLRTVLAEAGFTPRGRVRDKSSSKETEKDRKFKRISGSKAEQRVQLRLVLALEHAALPRGWKVKGLLRGTGKDRLTRRQRKLLEAP